MSRLGCPWVPVTKPYSIRGVGLGQAQIAAPAASLAWKYLIGSVLAGAGASVIGEMLGGPDTEDSWRDRTVFNDRMQALQTGFLMVQCELGGASNGSFGCDKNGNCLCPAGTQPKCRLDSGKLIEWRSLRDGFSAFYAEMGGRDWLGSDWLTRDPSPAEVAQARTYARKLVKFFIDLPLYCPRYQLPFDLGSIVAAEVGTTAQQVAQKQLAAQAAEPAWVRGVKYAAIGVGVIGVIWLGTTLRQAFKKD